VIGSPARRVAVCTVLTVLIVFTDLIVFTVLTESVGGGSSTADLPGERATLNGCFHPPLPIRSPPGTLGLAWGCVLLTTGAARWLK
jgi:hypothetical protein